MASPSAVDGTSFPVPAAPVPSTSTQTLPRRVTVATPPSLTRTPQQFSLEQLPTELLYPIAAFLVPDPPLTTRFALRSTGTWEFRDADHQWTDWLVGHNKLLAFAMTCRRMAAIATPLLYHTLVLRDHRCLITLFQRLRRRPEIKPWIRSVTCFANLAGRLTIVRALQEWQLRGEGMN